MVGKQAQAFLLGEGDRWYERNLGKTHEPDPVMEAIERLPPPKSVLEVGCGDGWRLKKIARKYNSRCDGLEPSGKALGTGPASWNPVFGDGVLLNRGTASGITGNNQYDLIIFAFCLYLVDREDLFEVVSRSDRALMDGGHIIIHDFFSNAPYSRVYHHAPELKSYHMDHSKLWEAHPFYSLTYIHGRNGGDWAVTTLRKQVEGAFPVR